MRRPTDPTRERLLLDALAIARTLERLDLGARVERVLTEAGLTPGSVGPVDLVALGKAAPELARAARRALGGRVRRAFVVAEVADEDALVGDHPRPGPASLEAGARLLDFLDAASPTGLTLFLVSGGASSLVVAPVAPLGVADLAALFDAASARGVEVVTLNRLRAATSWLSGGAVLTRVRTPDSLALVAVDVAAGGAEWVASALTYDYRPDEAEVERLLAAVGLEHSALAGRVREAAATRRGALAPVRRHTNRVLVEPGDWRAAALETAAHLGYATIDLGAVAGRPERLVEAAAAALRAEPERALCALGVGEATPEIGATPGRGGRCQEWCAHMSGVLARAGRPALALGYASDGRDHVEGVGGAWSDDATLERAHSVGLDVAGVLARHDTHALHEALSQLLEGGHTGWNLCDLYLVVAGPSTPSAQKSPPT